MNRCPTILIPITLVSPMAACGFPRPADVPGPDECIPNSASCGPGPNEIDRCGPDGLPAGRETCLLACETKPTPQCAYVEPRYLPDVCDAVAPMPSFTVTNFASFDTNLDNNCTGGVFNQDGGPPICIVRYGSIEIATTGTLTVSGARAIALVADSAIMVNGVLDVGGKGFASGPGGGTVSSGAKVGSDGGGGAGFATVGGPGGSATMDGGGGLGGGKATDPSLLTVLVGGTSPANIAVLGPNAGGGGGAATLIACRGQVSVSGMIDAGGGGGDGGRFGISMFSKFAGAGGGSGGNVVLQGLSIIVTGQIFANGGGGGGGLFVNPQGGGTVGGIGGNGTRSATVAASGGSAPATAGGGGTGGLQGTAPGVGLRPSDTSGFPGGGGGSVGFFQAYTPIGTTPTLTPSAASPAFSANKAIRTR